MSVSYFGTSSNPGTDPGTNTASPVVIVVPGGCQAGDLVFVTVCFSGTSGTISVTNTGGQVWNALTQRNQTRNRTRSFWCVFNGTWTANPSFATASGANGMARMLVYRSSYGAGTTWTVNVAEVSGTYGAPSSPYQVTITGITPTAHNVVVIAVWTSADDNTWVLETGGWGNPGGAQLRNTSGTYQQSMTFADMIQSSPSLTGDVMQSQATNYPDAGTRLIIAFKEVPPPIIAAGAIATHEAIGTAKIYAKKILAAGAIASLLALGTPQVGSIKKLCGAIPTKAALGTPHVVTKVYTNITSAGAMPTTAAIGVPKLKGTVKSAGGIPTATALGSAKTKGTIKNPTGIPTAAAIGTAKTKGWILPTGIATKAALGTTGLNANPFTIYYTGNIATHAALGTPRLRGIIKPTAIASTAAIGTAAALSKKKCGGIPSKADLGIPGVYTKAYTAISGAGAIATTRALGTLTLTGLIRPTGIVTQQAFGTSLVTLHKQISNAGAISTTAALGTAYIYRPKKLCGAIPTKEGLGTPHVAEKYPQKAISGVGNIPTKTTFGTLWIYRIDFCGNILGKEAFGTPKLRGILKPTAITTLAALGSNTLFTGIKPTGIATHEALGTPVLPWRAVISAGGVPSAAAFGTPKLRGTITAAGAVATITHIGTASVSKRHISDAGRIDSKEVFGFPHLQPWIKPTGIATTAAIGTLHIAKAYRVHETGAIVSAEVLGTPTVFRVVPPMAIGVRGPARFERWFECAVCGFSYPASELTRDQWGRRVCSDCLDEPSNEDYIRADTPAASNTKPPWPEDK